MNREELKLLARRLWPLAAAVIFGTAGILIARYLERRLPAPPNTHRAESIQPAPPHHAGPRMPVKPAPWR